jgi:hypothetical protein
VTGDTLLLLMLLVSWTSLVLQSIAAMHLWRQHGSFGVEQLATRRLVETAACRVLAASVYATAALLQVLGIRIPGGGVLGPEALVIFTGVQLLWWYNAARDVAFRRQLHRHADIHS